MADSWKQEGPLWWQVRALEKADLGAVLAIERASFPSPWSEVAFLQEMSNSFSSCWVLEGGHKGSPQAVLGYLCVWIVLDEMHIMNLATHPSHRRRGVALRLLCHCFEQAREMGVETMVLEVRPSNLPAQSLYQSLGFRPEGRRPGYYRDTGEDAVVMVKRMREADEAPSGADRVRP